MKILISHSWEDKLLAAQISETIKKDGHEVWFDIHQLIPGDNIQKIIDIYIKKCDAVVLLWSINAFGSDGVQAEVSTAVKNKKRIIPLKIDSTPLNHNNDLKGLLGIPFDDTQTGILLLQRCLLMLMSTDKYKDTQWFKDCFENVVDLGGYLNYVNTYWLKKNKKKSAGHKKQWEEKLEELKNKNEYILSQLIPQINDKTEILKNIIKELEQGNVPIEKLTEWQNWCEENESYQPDVIKKLKDFIANDIDRIANGGAPVSMLDIKAFERVIERLDTAITQKKDTAFRDLFSSIKKYTGFLIGEKTINSIVTSYLNYVTTAPQILRDLLEETRLTEYVAVKESTVKLVNYLENQDHKLEMRKNNLEGYFDDAYIINNTVQLLIQADLVAKNNISLDFVSAKIIDKYVSFLLNRNTKSKLDLILQDIRNLIGLKKREINWGKVASFVISASAIYTGDLSRGFAGLNAAAKSDNEAESNNEVSSPYFEDRMAAINAKYGMGLNLNSPIQY